MLPAKLRHRLQVVQQCRPDDIEAVRNRYAALNIPAELLTYIEDMALAAHRLLGCKGASRSDFRWDDSQGEAGVYLLEVNTQPGMTPLSLVPEQARQKGISYGELVERIIAEALGVKAKEDAAT